MKSHSYFPAVISVGLLLAMTGCKTTTNADKPHPAATAPKKKPVGLPTLEQPYNDVAFQSFLGRLRKAVVERDLTTVASMMTKDFGYRLDPPGEGAGVFAYWDENNLWPELELVLKERFVLNQTPGSSEVYMVAPAEFLTDPASYTGYRAGIRQENGSWKFAYFVAG